MTKVIEAKALAAAGKNAREVYQAADRAVQHCRLGHRTRPERPRRTRSVLLSAPGGSLNPLLVSLDPLLARPSAATDGVAGHLLSL